METFAVATAPTPAARSWPASLVLEVAEAGDRTRLIRNRHQGPLRVQRPFYPEGGVCHLYLLHPPGGLVSGDWLTVSLQAEPGSHVLVTTPAAGKVYRAAPTGEGQLQASRIRVKEGAVVEWLPQDTIVFDGARGQLDLRVELEGDGCFIGWEMTCLGRAAGGHPFDRGQLIQRLRVVHEGRPLLLERMQLDADSEAMTAPWGLDQATVMATALVTLPGIEEARCQALLETSRAHWGEGAGVTRVRHLLVVRALAHDAQTLRTALQNWWRAIRPIRLAREASVPRIWLT